MKFLSFHLMPYRHLDFEAAAKHRSAWVVLPNSLYDPVKGADEYERLYRPAGLWRRSSASTGSASTSITRPPTA